MTGKIHSIFLAGVALLLPLAGTAQQDKPVYTFVAEWDVPRAQWNEFTSHFEQNLKPVLERLLNDGAILEYAASATVVHTKEGFTHSTWWSAPSIAGIERVRTELVRVAPSPAMAAAKHHDHLLRSMAYRTRSTAPTSGYFYVSFAQVQPGKGEEYRELWDQFAKPVFEELFNNGTILAYGLDAEYVHTDDPGYRFSWYATPSADAVDKVNAALDPARQKIMSALAEAIVVGSHRDSFERLTHYAHK